MSVEVSMRPTALLKLKYKKQKRMPPKDKTDKSVTKSHHVLTEICHISLTSQRARASQFNWSYGKNRVAYSPEKRNENKNKNGQRSHKTTLE